MKRLLLAGLVTLVLGVGNVYGMDSKESNPQPHEISTTTLKVVTHTDGYINGRLPSDFSRNNRTHAYNSCRTYNDVIGIIEKRLDQQLKEQSGSTRSAKELDSILNGVSVELETLLGVQYSRVEFTIALYNRTQVKRSKKKEGGISATRKLQYPKPDNIKGLYITVSTHKSNYVDEKISDKFQRDNRAEFNKRFKGATLWTHLIEIRIKECEADLKSRDKFWEIVEAFRDDIILWLDEEFISIDFTVYTKEDGPIAWTLNRPTHTSVTQTEPDVKEHSKETQYVQDDINGLTDSLRDLAITDADMKKVVGDGDGKYQVTFHDSEERARIQAIRIEIAEVRSMLRELLEQRKSGTPEERERARVIIAGIESVGEKGSVKIAEIVEDKGVAQLVEQIGKYNQFRRFVLELVSHAADKKDPLRKKAQYIINGLLYFARLLFKEDLDIRTIIKNNVDFIKIVAFILYTSKQKDGCTRRPLNLFYASDPAYARNIDATCAELREILHPQGKPVKKACCQWCGCGSKKPQAAVANSGQAKTKCCKGGCLTRCCSGSKPVVVSPEVVPQKCTCKSFSLAAVKTIVCTACLTAAWAFSEHVLAEQHGAGGFWPFV